MCILGVLYRLVEACLRKYRNKTFIDFANSNYFLQRESPSIDNNYTAATPTLRFNWGNFCIMTVILSLPVVIGLFLVTYAFKFAIYARINQGCIPCLFAITGIYIAILFYFCFKEVISCAKIIGIFLIIGCITFLAFDEK